MNKVSIRWQNIRLSRISPQVYPRYYRRRPGFAELVQGHHFLVDEEHSWCEIFYERIANGFWMLAMEIRPRGNNHYILEAKTKPTGFFSINLISSTGKIGYRDSRGLHWSDNQVVFSRPGAITEIYAEEGKVLKCCRLIFTDNYLAGLASPGETTTEIRQLEVLNYRISRLPLFRSPTTAEVFLQERLFNTLRYERKNNHYRPSVFGILFELTAFFLSSPWTMKLPPVFRNGIPPMPC